MQQAVRHEALTKELLNKLFNPPSITEPICSKCQGRGLYDILEDSIHEGFKVLMWYRCDLCRKGKIPASATKSRL